jgi:hypothetical protein
VTSFPDPAALGTTGLFEFPGYIGSGDGSVVGSINASTVFGVRLAMGRRLIQTPLSIFHQ